MADSARVLCRRRLPLASGSRSRVFVCESEADDVTQDALLRAFNKLESFRR